MAGFKQQEKQMAIVGSTDIRALKKKPDEVETSLKALQDLLWTLFQFDAADLDFGIYRIMNEKRAAVKGFIDTDLPNIVDEEFGKVTIDQRSEIDEKVKVLKKEITEKLGAESVIGDSINPTVASLPIAKSLGEQLVKMLEARDTATISQEFRRDIYNHIYAFFSRYYDSGDFMSKRRRSTAKEQYAVPYNGEEVILYWANKDQYYIKTADHFRNFIVKDPGEYYSIHFRIVSARQIIGNVKETQDNYFVLHEGANAITYNAETRELVILFEYRLIEETEKNGLTRKDKIQDFFIDEAVKKTLETKLEKGLIDLLTKVIDKEKGTIWLKNNLLRYVKENKTDYFIHKDLRRFLITELDFYIKNEMFYLDDLGTEKEVPLGPYVNRVRVMKAVSLKIIDFLAQIEDFQKRLWEKKKFVIASHYCMTLDRIPPEFYSEIATNTAQFDEWKKLYGIEEGAWKTLSEGEKGVDFLKAHPFLVLDTKLFDDEGKYPGFKDRLLASLKNPDGTPLDDLDDTTGGLMVKSENWQALNLLQTKFENQIKCIYIDPPFNTGSDGFLYKDNYQSSSWLSMIGQTLMKVYPILSDSGSFFVSCDENELLNLGELLNSFFGKINHVETIVWNKRVPKNDKGIGNIHEYIFLFAKNYEFRRKSELKYTMRKDALAEIYDLIDKCKQQRISIIDSEAKLKEYYRKQGFDRGITLYCELDPKYKIWGKINLSWPSPNSEGPRYEIINPITKKPVPIPKKGWRWKEETFREAENNGPEYKLPDGSLMKGRIWYSPSQTVQPSSIIYLEEVESFLLRSILSLKSNGSLSLEKMDLTGLIDYPKPVLLNEWIFYSVSEKTGYFLDYFAGSGTSAHALLQLNREDGGTRKYILIEMAGYFDTVMKPRIQKVLYSSEWNDGKPQNTDGISHIFRYILLEQYEDSLNNIEFQVSGTVERKLTEIDDYFLRYMLDFETRDSPCRFNVAKLERPFEYTLWIMRDGVRQKERVDLIETFNYLLGLHVKRLRRFDEDGVIYRVVHGEKNGKTITIIWRTTTNLNLEKDKKFIENKLLKNKEFKAEQVFINGDFFVENALPIESEFQDRMNVEFKSTRA